MEPILTRCNGFIDKYTGDAIMAMFDERPDNAVDAAITIINHLGIYHLNQKKSNYNPIDIGIGISTGSLMLGTIGGPNRMDTSVISDAVNLASRVESLTKNYGCSIIITEYTLAKLQNAHKYYIRKLDETIVKGKSYSVKVYEILNCYPDNKQEKILKTKPMFEEAIELYFLQAY